MKRALILMYHMVDEPESAKEHRFCTPPTEFARQMAWLMDAGYTPIGLETMTGCMNGDAPWPKKPVHITFDDGFEGVLQNALPVLDRHSIPATLFAVSDLLGGTNEWMHTRGFPRRKLLNWPQLRELDSAGVRIGSHTRTHARLTELDQATRVEEIGTSREILEDGLGKPVDYFAYPYGLLDDETRLEVKTAGYTAACSTLSGFNRSGQDRFMLRRIDIFGTDRLWQFRQKLRFGTNESSRMRPLRYYASRLRERIGLTG